MNREDDRGDDPKAPLTTPSSELFRDELIQGCSSLAFEGEQRPALGGVILLSRLGRGGMASVYYGRHPRLDVEVAVKVISRALLEGRSSAVGRFIQEAQIAARLNSEHLVHVYDVDRDEESGLYYIVMEYVRGPNAAEWARRKPDERVSELEALDLCLAATNGLAVAHGRGIIHRDIKPGNILVPLGPGGRPSPASAKLADLGLAKFEESVVGMTQTEMGMGTPGYMAPEQFENVRYAGRTADVFGMGATLYSLLAGQSPFATRSSTQSVLAATMRGDYTPLSHLRPDVSAKCVELLDRCLRIDPALRFADATALAEGIRDCREACLERQRAESDSVNTKRSTMERLPPTVAVRGGSVEHATEPAASGRSRGGPGRPAGPRLALALLLPAAGAVVAWRLLSSRPDQRGSEAQMLAEAEPLTPSSVQAASPSPDAGEEPGVASAKARGGSTVEPLEAVPTEVPVPAFEAPPSGPLPVVATRLVVAHRVQDFQAGRHTLRIGSEAVTVAADGRFQHAIELADRPEGPCRVVAEVLSEQHGETLDSWTIEAVIDRTAPTLDLTTPILDGGRYHSSTPATPLAGFVRDPNGAKLLIGETPTILSVEGRFDTTAELRPGENSVSVVVRDSAGNEGRTNLLLVLDQELPELSVAPLKASAEAGRSRWRVAGEIHDDHPGSYLLVDGVREELVSDGTFEFPFPDDRRTLSLTAVDRAGNRSSPRTVTLPDVPTGPMVTIQTEPFTRLDPVVVLRGTASQSTSFLEIGELDPRSGKPRGPAIRVEPDRSTARESESWPFEVQIPGGLSTGSQRHFRITAYDTAGIAGYSAKAELSGAVEIGILERVDELYEWVVVKSADRHKATLETVRVDLDHIVTEDDSLLLVKDRRNLLGDRGLTAVPAGDSRLSDFVKQKGTRVYLLIPMRTSTSGK